MKRLGSIRRSSPLTDADLRAQCRAAAACAWQLSTFWKSTAAMGANLANYAAHIGAAQRAERLCRAAARTAS